ncbi:MAG: methionyl-tRNA formyltransferase [Proteiniphilum sp.]|jgi:methionyl-tRNA formyltransferase|uniref:methionyl-tRNA formyltransferase n=1 Tax=Proteiniphilum sp. TaxID=1926877 RepID=UPI00092A3C09|nr:methionyl-tRNA formyltransferase [Proteiniphilum sp.]MEA5129924.1 methionyl-tRNA formyltransferase [Proteiniphilum sp.]OJV83043.1 MAG: methionyl-tRNA formyltransferase [Bacteroidia bacterium 44-10]
MDKKSIRILFMGTPEFAVESLKALIENGYNVIGVVTMPDKPAGRGYKLQPSPVKQYALQRGLPVLQPEKLKNEGFLHELKRLNVDLQIVVAFRMLPEVVWNMPPKGTFNLHSSLLPQYRGAAPINWAIINGEKETGVTTFFLSHEIDTGKIIFQEKTTIDETDNAGTLHDRLMIMGAQLVLKTVNAILEENIQTVPQDKLFKDLSELKNAPKIFKEDCRIDWNKPVREVYNYIRGLSPYPAAWTELVTDNEEKQRFKLFAGEPIEDKTHDLQPGTIRTDNKSHLDVAVKDSFLRITELQLTGKRRMSTIDFLNGYHFEEKARFC